MLGAHAENIDIFIDILLIYLLGIQVKIASCPGQCHKNNSFKN